MAQQEGVTIVIKKIKKGGGHVAHHGGSWKVAYADFVTAMMAFFLMLWLLTATTEDQRQGLAEYFSPTPGAIMATTGGKGLMRGESVATEGSYVKDKATPGLMVMLPEEDTPLEESEQEQEKEGKGEEEGKDKEEMTEEEAEKLLEERERERFEKAEKALKDAIEESDELRGLSKSLIIDQMPEGMRIQIIDQEGVAMFARGSTSMSDEARQLIALVVKAVGDLPNRVTVSGHTDATRYTRYGYDNWDLSADRANSSRRAMVKAGLDSDRIFRVTGRASEDLVDKENPTAPVNRRISMVLLRQSYLKKFEEDLEKQSSELLEEIKAENAPQSSPQAPSEKAPEAAPEIQPESEPQTP